MFLANYAELKNIKSEEARRDRLLKEGNFLPMKQPDCDSPLTRDSEEEAEGDADFTDEEETKAQTVNSSQTKSLQPKAYQVKHGVKQEKSPVVIGSSALQFVRSLHRYTELMQMLPHMAFEIFLCLSYQLDLYFLTVLHLFARPELYHQLFSDCFQDLKSQCSKAMAADEIVAKF